MNAAAFFSQRPRSEKQISKLRLDAFLRAMLADGPKPVREIEGAAVCAGLLNDGGSVSQAQAMRAARERLGIVSKKTGAPGEAGEWLWVLPGG